ncbi:hypothetical protein F5Y07DRAFT_410513 [Xylaria sp. FL0933]|nr:hypothetical protein F5Y07DRAFT_410513 [Xylaria sp. FL0933]
MADQKEGLQKWTEAEKIHFLMEAIAQMQASGATLNFQKFTLPGRTPKALSHFWAKVRKENAAYVAQLGNQDGASAANGEAKTPKSGASTPANRKRTSKAAGLTNGDGDGDGDSQGKSFPALTFPLTPATPTPTPIKRARSTPKPRGKAKSAPAAPANAAEATHEEVEDQAKEEAKQEDVEFDMQRFDNEFFYGAGHV